MGSRDKKQPPRLRGGSRKNLFFILENDFFPPEVWGEANFNFAPILRRFVSDNALHFLTGGNRAVKLRIVGTHHCSEAKRGGIAVDIAFEGNYSAGRDIAGRIVFNLEFAQHKNISITRRDVVPPGILSNTEQRNRHAVQRDLIPDAKCFRPGIRLLLLLLRGRTRFSDLFRLRGRPAGNEDRKNNNEYAEHNEQSRQTAAGAV